MRAPQLEDPELNIQLGAYYLRYVLDKLDGLQALGAAAYNAGPGRAQAWRGSVPLEGAIYVETIPFNETRDYAKKVLANAMFYQARLGLHYVALKDRLGTIAPAGAAGPETRGAEAAAGGGTQRRRPMSAGSILVLGGSGFVGRHFVARLVAAAGASSCRRGNGSAPST